MKKILFITAFLPHPAAAAEKNTMILLSDLSKKYQVDLFYFKNSTQRNYEPNSINVKVVGVEIVSLRSKLFNILKFPFVHPFFSVKFSNNVQKKINALIDNNNYDAIVFEHAQTFLYAKYIKTAAPKFLYSHDVMYQRALRSSNYFTALFCKYSEKFALNVKNAYFFSVSIKDCDLLNDYYRVKAHPCLAYIDKEILRTKPSTVENRFVFFGNWRRKDNSSGALYFMNKVLPLINFKTTLSIIGSGFPMDKIITNNPKVIIENLGFVDNPYPIIANSRAMISPLFTGAGTKQKVFESLACGTPVIGTEIAFEGIDTNFSNYMLLCSKESDYIEAMKSNNFSYYDRCTLKDAFIKAYQSKTLKQYIEDVIG